MVTMRTLSGLLLVVAASSSALADRPAIDSPAAPAERAAKNSLQVSSSAFEPHGSIPNVYTCDGKQLSPPIQWTGVPADTRSIAILAEDPDAPDGPFTHWLVTNIAPTTTSIGGGAALPAGAMAARNSAGRRGFTAPCPASGQHHFVFRVYALDMAFAKQLVRARFLSAIEGHVLAQGELVGMYDRANKDQPRRGI